MLYLDGLRENLGKIGTLARPYVRGDGLQGVGGLRAAYVALLKEVQPRVPRSVDGGVESVRGGERRAALMEIFNQDSFLDDTRYELGGEPGHDGPHFELLDQSRSTIAAADPELDAMFRLAITTVFAAPCVVAGGGTTSSAVGVLWIDPRDAWSEQDRLEFIIHELAHTLMFLDEWRYAHYRHREDILSPETFALSTIRATKRPMDKVLHSIVVGTEVLLARDAWLGHGGPLSLHPPSTSLAESVLRSIRSVREVDQKQTNLTSRAVDLLDRCESRLSARPGLVARKPGIAFSR